MLPDVLQSDGDGALHLYQLISCLMVRNILLECSSSEKVTDSGGVQIDGLNMKN